MAFEYVNSHYGVTACMGRRVIAYGKPGVIAEDRGHHIGINLDQDKPGVIRSYHPKDGIEYLETLGVVRPMTRSQKRYDRWLEYCDSFDSFRDFLAWDAEPQRSWNVK